MFVNPAPPVKGGALGGDCPAAKTGCPGIHPLIASAILAGLLAGVPGSLDAWAAETQFGVGEVADLLDLTEEEVRSLTTGYGPIVAGSEWGRLVVPAHWLIAYLREQAGEAEA